MSNVMIHNIFKRFAVNCFRKMKLNELNAMRLSSLFQVNSVNCNTSWKIVLFMKWSDNQEIVLKGVCLTAT